LSNDVDKCDVIILSEINIPDYECPLFCIEGFEMFSFCQRGSAKGGIMMFVKSELAAKDVSFKISSCESIKVRLNFSKRKLLDVIAVY